MSQERVPVRNEATLPLSYGSLELPQFSAQEQQVRDLPASVEDLDKNGTWVLNLKNASEYKGSVALRAIDELAQSFVVERLEFQEGISLPLLERARKAVRLRERAGIETDSPEHFVMRELCAKVNRLRFDLVSRWIQQSPDTGLSRVAELEYQSLCPAMAALDNLYLKFVTEKSPIDSDERERRGMKNEGCVVRSVKKLWGGEKVVEVPMHEAYPEENRIIVNSYRKLLDRLFQLQHESSPRVAAHDLESDVTRKIRYYAAVLRAYETSDPKDWEKADSLFTQQITGPDDVLHVHDFETGYSKDKIVRTPEISLRAPDAEAEDVREMSVETKGRMLVSMENPVFAGVPTMDESKRLVRMSNTATRHFLGAGMETFDLKPAGQMLPNEYPPRARGGVDSSLDLKTMGLRQELINKSFIAVFGENVFKKDYEPRINTRRFMGRGIAAHEFGHAVGLTKTTYDRLGKKLVHTHVEEWKATAGSLVLSAWLPFTRGEATMEDLKDEILDQMAGAARYAATRDHDSSQPYYRHSMMFMKVAEDVGLVRGAPDNTSWTVDLSEAHVRQFFEKVTEQYATLLKIYATGTREDLEAFLGEHLKTTSFIEYMSTAAEKVNEQSGQGKPLPTPRELASIPPHV